MALTARQAAGSLVSIGILLAGGRRHPTGPGDVRIVVLRTAVGPDLVLGFGLLVVPALGFSPWYARAAFVLLVLPAPFVIAVYFRRNTAFIGSVQALSAAALIVLIAALFAVLGIAGPRARRRETIDCAVGFQQPGGSSSTSSQVRCRGPSRYGSSEPDAGGATRRLDPGS